MSSSATVSVAAESHFPLPDVVIARDATSTHWASYFLVSELPLSMNCSRSGSMCRIHIALQELQAIALMLHRMAFQLSSKVVALQLLQKLICVIKVAQPHFFFPDFMPHIESC